jgi:hypothetical protein
VVELDIIIGDRRAGIIGAIPSHGDILLPPCDSDPPSQARNNPASKIGTLSQMLRYCPLFY